MLIEHCCRHSKTPRRYTNLNCTPPPPSESILPKPDMCLSALREEHSEAVLPH